MIRSDFEDGVGVLTLDRHERRNALDVQHCRELRESATTLVDQGVRAVVITGSGTTFSAGADLDEVYSGEFRAALYAALHGIAALEVPVIAAVNGPAVGAGTQLALACDLRVAAPEAFFSVPTAKNGLAVDEWTIRRLASFAGGGTARAVLLGCERLDASAALQRGLADRIGGLENAVGWAHEIAAMAPLSLRYSKSVLELLCGSGAEPTGPGFEDCWNSHDVREARTARAERRLPQFQGR